MSSTHPPNSLASPTQGPMRRAWATLWAMLRQRCPRCLTGRMFRGSFTMNDPCPVCGLVFQREEGYFLGAMYVSSVLSMAAATPIYFTLAHFLPEWDSILLALSAFVLYLPLTPVVFRTSRVVWIYLDRAVCSGSASAGAFEKVRLEQGDGKAAPPPGD
jgi:uncharacterized protein (DUF983 family)